MVLNNTGGLFFGGRQEKSSSPFEIQGSLKLQSFLLGRSVLGDGLGAFRDGVLGELTREQQADSGLNLSGRESGLLVVADQTAGFTSQALEQIVDERVHDGHGAARDTGIGVDLLQHLVGLVDFIPILFLCVFRPERRSPGNAPGCRQ